jgi:HK97 family phage major capsid protein
VTDSVAGDLKRHIYQAHADGPRKDSHWAMNLEWLNEIRRLDDNAGRLVWHPSTASAPLMLLGIPVEVRDDGGVPHLEPNR